MFILIFIFLEKKFEKLKRFIGKSKKAILDNQSMISVSLSRKSSFSSNASALAFSSPSLNPMREKLNNSVMLSNPENFLQPVLPVSSLENQLKIETTKSNNVEVQHVETPSNTISVNQNING